VAITRCMTRPSSRRFSMSCRYSRPCEVFDAEENGVQLSNDTTDPLEIARFPKTAIAYTWHYVLAAVPPKRE
jgi:hypothetical protein